jgi:prepilin-type N-terminal cleavage/methylation domain-containing protein
VTVFAVTRRERHDDGGFTLIEVLVAIALITMMMAALTKFFVGTGSVNNQQTGKQIAVQLADDGTERVRAIKGSSITTGRDKASSDAQWGSPVAGAEPYLLDMEEAWDAEAPFPAGATAALPTSPLPVTINDLAYEQYWYIGRCWQPSAGGTCGPSQVVGYAQFFRVVVAVTWHEKRCTNEDCAYLTATLVSSALSEPIFNPGAAATAPAINNPGAQVGEVSVPVAMTVNVTGGAPPVTFSATGLPTGLSMNSAGLVSGTPTTPGMFTVTTSVTDGFALSGSAVFLWVINPVPTLANPGTRTSQGGTATSVTLSVTGGTAPMTYSVTAPGPWGSTGLPPGLTLNAASGLISGVPNTASSTANSVTVAVTDTFGVSSTATFVWNVPVLSVTNPGNQASETSASVTRAVAATGGVKPYKWSATGLPTGLAIDSTGTVTGRPTTVGSFSVTVTTVDAKAATVTTSFGWTITAGPAIGAPTAVGQANPVGTAISLASTATLGSGVYTWSATGLPGGLSINPSTGLISGTINAGTRYITTVAVVDSAGGTASVSFVWAVSASGTTLRVTNPTGDLTTAVGAVVSLTAAASGGAMPLTWTATGLPSGLAMSTVGKISGTLLSQGTYPVTVVVTDNVGARATMMFTWTIT